MADANVFGQHYVLSMSAFEKMSILKSLNVGTDKWEELANDRVKGDLLYTEVLKKEKSNQFFKKLN